MAKRGKRIKRSRVRVDYRTRAKAELDKAIAYPPGQPTKAAYKNKYRAALRRAIRHARTALFHEQWNEAAYTRFMGEVNRAWK